jgi:predicted DsbA family dithiol-disulfide isomerase
MRRENLPQFINNKITVAGAQQPESFIEAFRQVDGST